MLTSFLRQMPSANPVTTAAARRFFSGNPKIPIATGLNSTGDYAMNRPKAGGLNQQRKLSSFIEKNSFARKEPQGHFGRKHFSSCSTDYAALDENTFTAIVRGRPLSGCGSPDYPKPQRCADFGRVITTLMKEQGACTGRPLFQGKALRVHLLCAFPSGHDITRPPDSDNLAKMTLDGLQGVLFENDATITELSIGKVNDGGHGGKGYTKVKVERLSPTE